MKSEVTTSEMTKGKGIGDLVAYKYGDLIVLMTSEVSSNDTFRGVVIHSGPSCHVGKHEEEWYVDEFELFRGEIKLTQ